MNNLIKSDDLHWLKRAVLRGQHRPHRPALGLMWSEPDPDEAGQRYVVAADGYRAHLLRAPGDYRGFLQPQDDAADDLLDTELKYPDWHFFLDYTDQPGVQVYAADLRRFAKKVQACGIKQMWLVYHPAATMRRIYDEPELPAALHALAFESGFANDQAILQEVFMQPEADEATPSPVWPPVCLDPRYLRDVLRRHPAMETFAANQITLARVSADAASPIHVRLDPQRQAYVMPMTPGRIDEQGFQGLAEQLLTAHLLTLRFRHRRNS